MRGLASFLMLPIYTQYLAPSDYGTIEILNMIVDLAALLFGARITAGIFRFHSRAEGITEKRKVITTSIYITTLLNALCVTSLILFSSTLADLTFGSSDYQSALAVFSVSLIFASFNEVCLAYIRILDRPYLFVLISFIRLMLQLGLNIYFIVFLDMTYWGVVYSTIIAGFVTAIILGIFTFGKVGLAANLTLIKPMIDFTIPIILSSIALFLISFGDRYVIRLYHGLDQVGLYALAYKFGQLLFRFIWSPFMTYWEPKQYDLLKAADGKEKVASVFRNINALFLFSALCISLICWEIIYVMADPAYYDAAPIAPFIVYAFVFQGWTGYCRLGLLSTGKTSFIAYSSYATLIIALALYFLLIPSFGALGAGMATVLSVYIRYLMILYWSQKQLTIPYSHKYNYILIALSIAIITAFQSLEISIYTAAIKAFVLIAVAAILFWSPMVEQPVRSEIIMAIRSKFKSA